MSCRQKERSKVAPEVEEWYWLVGQDENQKEITMKEYMVLFYTHSGAIKFSRKAKIFDFACELMPVPRQLSSNCGVGAKIVFNNDIQQLVDEEIEKIYHCDENGYALAYNGE